MQTKLERGLPQARVPYFVGDAGSLRQMTGACHWRQVASKLEIPRTELTPNIGLQLVGLAQALRAIMHKNPDLQGA